MNDKQEEIIKLPSGFNVFLSTNSYYNHYCNFTESQFLSFNYYVNGGTYFPQIMQFVAVVSAILSGRTSFHEILLCNIIFGIGNMLLWHWGRFYKLPLLGLVSCIIGGSIFRYFLPYIALAIIAFFVLKDWKIFLFCAICGIITFVLKSILFSRFLTNTKYTDEIVRYVSSFKYKQ